jgi:hypothetical protein
VIDKELLQAYPTKRIKPIDGLSVTAEVWDEAHEYHRLRQRYHTLLAHGCGIVAGMEVIASEPADSQVYIMPGMAISPSGDEIVLTEAIAYDLGTAQDTLHIILSFAESAPAADPGGNDGARLYVHCGFEVEARSSAPSGPHIELARIKRTKRDAPISNANDPAHPHENQIDQRFRRVLMKAPPETASIAVIYMGGQSDGGAGKGVDQMVRTLNAGTLQRACVDDGVSLVKIEPYTLVCLTAQSAFQINPDEMNTLYAYLQGGGTLFIESNRQPTASGDPTSDSIFLDLLSSFGIKLDEVKAGHELLNTPNLFGALPAGYEGAGKGKLMAGGGVIFSTAGYMSVWRGEQRSGYATREDIRAAQELGANLVAFAHGRHATH